MSFLPKFVSTIKDFTPYTIYYFMIFISLLPLSITSYNACDWTGSGLATSRANREIVSINLRCTSGRITWKYPRGAIRILLQPPIGFHDNYRACIKLQPTWLPSPSTNKTVNTELYSSHKRNDLIINSNNQHNQHHHRARSRDRIARIYLEVQKHLVPLYDESSEHGRSKLVKCFMSVNQQVALYVEAEELPFENIETIFKYNLDFINNKHHTSQSSLELHQMQNAINIKSTSIENSQVNNNNIRHNIDKKLESHRNIATNSNIDEDFTLTNNNFWWPWNKEIDEANKFEAPKMSTHERGNLIKANSERDIIGAFGESWEICRPCTDIEMANVYCSSDIVTRGKIFGVQSQPHLDTVEITVKHLKILRNNMVAIMDAEDASRYYYRTKRRRKKRRHHNESSDEQIVDYSTENPMELKFHTPTHCSASHGAGEFVFMGRRRFEEMMLICAPRLAEWSRIVNKFNGNNQAPCILSS